ncbi:hypothetical protein E4T47_09272 [Aureobasidium subglaciale]|nr:hypothetical protein E4T47_09272 [Aureobasidium subglaciale]
MASLALGAFQRPLEDYLDAETLKDSYQAAYRLMLAQKLVDILSKDFTTNETYSGTRFHESEALIMVPTFVYVVEGLLATTVIAALLIAAIPSWRKTSLTSEPANLAAMMALSSNDHLTAETMSDKDFATSDELERVYHETTFASIDGDQGPTLHCINPDSQVTMYDRSERPAIPVLPFELSWYFGIGFFALQSLVVVALIFAYILVKYLPMVVGAFFEPVFTLLTRTLCMLEPYEQLRKGHAMPSKAILVDYNSLPPQLIVLKALKTGSLSLASTCCIMTLLANLLSIAFSSILHERSTVVPISHDLTGEYHLPLTGSNLPYPAWDQYYVAMSNLTAGTPLPAWTDEKFLYIPLGGMKPLATSKPLYRAQTPAVSASLHCYPIYQSWDGRNLTWDLPIGTPSCKIYTSRENYRMPQSEVPEAVELISFSSWVRGCELTVVAGWGRTSSQYPMNASWVGCKPELYVERREVVVNAQGFVQSSALITDAMDDQEQLSVFTVENVVDAVHALLDRTITPEYPYHTVLAFHSDSIPSDWLNYLLVQMLNTPSVLDPHIPPPTSTPQRRLFKHCTPRYLLSYWERISLTSFKNPTSQA